MRAALADESGPDVTSGRAPRCASNGRWGRGRRWGSTRKDGNPFLATAGLRVGPAPTGSGVDFRPEAEPGSMPYAFFEAVEDTVRKSPARGLHGRQVADCAVIMTRRGCSPRRSRARQGFDKSVSSTGAGFRGLTPLVLTEALRRAGTRVHEPAHRFRGEAPVDTLGALLPVPPGLSVRAVRAVSPPTGPSSRPAHGPGGPAGDGRRPGPTPPSARWRSRWP